MRSKRETASLCGWRWRLDDSCTLYSLLSTNNSHSLSLSLSLSLTLSLSTLSLSLSLFGGSFCFGLVNPFTERM
jgi:hypothetical protein